MSFSISNWVKRHQLFAIFTISIGITNLTTAQDWVNSMQNKDKNFHEVQQQFNDYWKNRKIEKGKGYKQFKRWEWYWKNRVNSEGEFPNAGKTLMEFENFKRKNTQGSSRNGNWTAVGPTSFPSGYAGIGRINSVAFHPTNTNIVFAGAAGGGLWKSSDGGNTWITLTDNIATLGVSGIAIDPTNPNTMYIATGDGDGGDNYSVGVLKSTDGGNTWNTTGFNWSSSSQNLIRRIILDPDNASSLLIASDNGIWRTTNGGSTWTQEASGNFFDIEANPTGSTNTFYASTENTIYKSTDNGNNWSSVQTIGSTNRIALAVTPANSTYVYALCSKSSNSGFNGLYRSTNSGGSFTVQSTTPNILGYNANGSDTGGQGWYDLQICADPTNATTIYVGGVNNWKSTNGGTTWTLKSHWSGSPGVQTVHADKHALEFQGTTSLWEGNDGGLYKTTDGGNTWTAKHNGILISQMYRLGVSQSDNKVITGLQDNGTKLKSATGTWTDEIGGDGMECAIKPNNSQVLYGELYYGDLQRTTNGGNSWSSIQSNISGNPSGAWVTPFLIDPSNTSTIIAGYQNVYKSTNQGTNWTTIGNFTTETLTVLSISPSSSNHIYAGNDIGLWATTDGGVNWTVKTVPASNLAMLAVHPTNPLTIWAVCQNYSAGNKIFKSVNGGSTWTNISGSLPNIPANCVVYDVGTDDGIYIGMDVGIYYRDNSSTDWELFSTGLPNVEITELEIKESDGLIYASTFGRGLWVSEVDGSVPSCFASSSINISNILTTTATATWSVPTNPPDGYQWALNTSASPPSSGTFTNATTVDFTGLMANTTYYFHLRSDCTSSQSSWSTKQFKTAMNCSSNFTDSGGASQEYSNNEDITYIICPTNSADKIKVTFNSFGVEDTWDALYVFDGPNINSTQISSGNPTTQAGFPSGGYYGTNLPGPFQSTDVSGCLTFRFLSDQLVTDIGWTTTLECISTCTIQVSNTNDSGPGSLRYAISCAENGDQIVFDNSLIGQTINLTSTPISLTSNIMISQSPNTMLNIKSNFTGPIFNISSGVQISMENIGLFAGSGANTMGRAISNRGTLNLTNVVIHDNASYQGQGATISNIGTINMFGTTQIILD